MVRHRICSHLIRNRPWAHKLAHKLTTSRGAKRRCANVVVEARAALEKLRDESARSGAEASVADQGSAGELASLRSQLEALRAQSAQDDAYKLQTMQYLRKYEAELQKKEKQLTELRQQLQTGGATGASENRR